MFKSREQAQYDAEVDALAKERQLYRDEAQKLAHKRQRAGEDTRELPLVSQVATKASPSPPVLYL